MWIHAWIKVFLQAAHRTIRAAVERPKLKEESVQEIQLTERENALYFRFPCPKVQLGYGVGGAGGRLDFSLADARALVTSIERACKRRDAVSVEFRDFSFTADARTKSHDSDRVIVRFGAPTGSVSTKFSRKHLLSGCEEFFNTFGKIPSNNVRDNADD